MPNLLQSLSEKRKAAERDLEAMVKDLKEKLDKYDNEKKGAAKVEKAKKEAIASRQEQEKKWAIIIITHPSRL